MNIEGKIWGSTSTLFDKNNVKINRAVIDGDYQCSKHRHPHSFNMFFVESGRIKVIRWKNDYNLIDTTYLGPGESTTVPPGEYHRFVCIDNAVVYEIYWVELQNDIEREDCGGPV